MSQNHYLYGVLGALAVYGLFLALFASRLPRFTSDRFRALPEPTRHKRLRSARRAGGTLAVVCTATFVGFAALTGWLHVRQARTAAARATNLSTLADELSQPLPKMVAAGTQWDTVTVEPGRVLAYNYTLVSVTADQVDRVAMAAAAKQLPSQICSDPEGGASLSSGATLRFTYRDKDHQPVASYDVRASDCP